jgi:hypothetical protein
VDGGKTDNGGDSLMDKGRDAIDGAKDGARDRMDNARGAGGTRPSGKN